jgi:tRNA threonylcarbamoyladenosine modification (KEOPS) complex  Pcc1 subunit
VGDKKKRGKIGKKKKVQPQRKTLRHAQKFLLSKKKPQEITNRLESLSEKRVNTELIVQIEMLDEKVARTVYTSILPETMKAHGYRSNVELAIDQNWLKLSISAMDIVALRAAANSFLRLIMVAMKTVHIVAPFYTT